jgi:septin 7
VPAAPASPPNGKPDTPIEQPEEFQSSNSGPIVPSQSSVIDNRNIVRRKLTSYVGFANLPNQWHRKSVRKGFNFNVMVVGKSSRLLQVGQVT